MTTIEIPLRFQEILRPHLPYADAGPLRDTDELGALGLDSMGVVALLGDLEDQYDLELPDEILNEETFATVGSLWSTVAPLLKTERVGDE
ncbi:MAG TPA: phosphopantetheine-binding protein [Micromonosporaceae bacterium]